MKCFHGCPDAPAQQISAWAPASDNKEALAELLTEMELRLKGQIIQTIDNLIQDMNKRFWINFAYANMVYMVALAALYPHVSAWCRYRR